MPSVITAPVSLTPITDANKGVNHQRLRGPSNVAGAGGSTPVSAIATLKSGIVGTAYSEYITAQGGVGGYTYAVTSGAPPNGLTLTGSSGLINGTPTTVENATFVVKVTDSDGNYSTQEYTMTIVAAASATGGNYGFIA